MIDKIMKITKQTFGEFQGTEVHLYLLENDYGMRVKVTNYGATITSIELPNGDGTHASVACGFDNFSDYFEKEYVENAPYFGCTVGRYCSQIKGAKFELDGKEYQLAENCGPNNLHGGAVGFDKKIWCAEETDEGLEMTLKSLDMEEGFPGNVDVKVTFNLSNDHALAIKYHAVTDKDTPILDDQSHLFQPFWVRTDGRRLYCQSV